MRTEEWQRVTVTLSGRFPRLIHVSGFIEGRWL